MDLARYRPNVGVVLARGDGKVWLGRRSNTPGPHNWQFPQGGMDAGESPLEAAKRELREETGVSSVLLLGQTPDWLAYRFPGGQAGRKSMKGWIGQKQLWFAFRFLGDEAEIDLNSHHAVEFDAWRWADFEEAPNLVVPFKQDVYRQVLTTLRPLVGR